MAPSPSKAILASESTYWFLFGAILFLTSLALF